MLRIKNALTAFLQN